MRGKCFLFTFFSSTIHCMTVLTHIHLQHRTCSLLNIGFDRCDNWVRLKRGLGIYVSNDGKVRRLLELFWHQRSMRESDWVENEYIQGFKWLLCKYYEPTWIRICEQHTIINTISHNRINFKFFVSFLAIEMKRDDDGFRQL
jgi:hypothetical protein